MDPKQNKNYLIVLLASYGILLFWSVIHPFDLLLWVYECTPAIVGVVVLVLTYPRFVFTKTTYTWCFIAACLMTIGAHYSFSEVPVFNYLRDYFGWNRNNFDKLGHVVQGLVPVLVLRELLIKRLKLKNVFWINFIALFMSLGVSGLYEIVEWLSTFIDSRTEGDFLGEQGYRWDAQSDMFMALLGAVLVLVFGRKNVAFLLNSEDDRLIIEQTD